MLCENCGKNHASVHLQQNINGVISEKNLCPACAAKLGLGGGFPEANMGSLVGNLLGYQKQSGSTRRCPACGSSFADIAAAGKAGCPDCYRTFKEEFSPSIARIHGDVVYRGRRPGGNDAQVEEKNPAEKIVPEEKTPISEIEGLRQELATAIEAQEYERAAVLRDEIKALEGGAEK